MFEDRACRKCGESFLGLLVAAIRLSVFDIATEPARHKDGSYHDFRRCTCKGAGMEHASDCPLSGGVS